MPHRILFPFTGTWLGGSHECTLTLVNHLDSLGFKALFALHDNGVIAELLERAGHEHDVFRGLRFPGEVSDEQFARWFKDHLGAAVRHIRSSAVDIVHVTETPASEFWAVAAAVANRPVIWHVHGRPSTLMTRLPVLAARYICVSRFVRDSLPEHLREKAVIIPNAFDNPPQIDRAAAHDRLAAELGLPAGIRFIGFCGRLSDSKRPDLFLEAAGRLAKGAGGPLAFVLLGDDRNGDSGILAARARTLGLDGRCFFLGYRRDALDLMAAFEVLLVPALDEAFGRVLVEAMSVGTAVVASNSGGHGEIIEDGRTGSLVAAADPAALADGALALLAGDGRAEIAVNAKVEVGRYFNPREVAQQVQDIYLEALAAPVSPISSLADVAANRLLRRILAAPSTRAWRSILRSETPSEERSRLALKILGSKMRRPLQRVYER